MRATRLRASAARGVVTLLVAASGLAGCVHYPAIDDIGTARIRPEDGRAVRQGEALAVYAILRSTGKYGDVIQAVSAPIARRAQLVSATGAPLESLEVPPATVMFLQDGGPHIVLSELTREPAPGEVFIVTLYLRKSGGLGIITVVR